MAAINDCTVTVFGGTGFLGRRVVRHLRNHGFSVRIASRHPNRGRELFGLDDPQVQSVEADIHDERSIASALAGVYGAVNAVSLYVERGRETFHSVHVEAAERVAAQARRAGVERLAHVSGIGSDAASPSLYIRKRGEGELAVRTAFVDAALVRPAVMFGPDDAFLTTILGLLGRLPVYPMFGRGRTKLQPAYVEDVAEAIARSSATDGYAGDHVRMRRPSRLHLRGIGQNHRKRSETQMLVDAVSVCRLARAGLACGNAPEPASHTQSSRTDAG